jgi:hypothetical protein
MVNTARRPPSPQHSRKRVPKPDRRHALELLAAASPDGLPEAVMLAHGFTVAQMVELIAADLATASAERVVAAGKSIEVARVKITDEGRRALAQATG